MNGHVSCSVPGCTNPVIGQCIGYDGPCGRFYCSSHSSGRLCSDCAIAEQTERLEKEYAALATKIKGFGLFVAVLSGWGLLLIILLVSAAQRGIQDVSPYGITAIIGMFVIVIIWGIRVKYKVDSADLEYPHFKEYYKAWQRKKGADAVRVITTIAIATVISSPQQRMQRDIHNISNRVDRM